MRFETAKRQYAQSKSQKCRRKHLRTTTPENPFPVICGLWGLEAQQANLVFLKRHQERVEFFHMCPVVS
jgi:hypothetical protein